MSDQIYILFRNGLKWCKVIGKEQWYIQIRNFKTLKWAPEKILENNDIPPDEVPLLGILEKTRELDKISWEGDELITSWGAHYKLENSIDSQQKTVIWADRSDNPLDVVLLDGVPVAYIFTNFYGCSILVKDGYQDYTPLKLWKDPQLPEGERGIEHLGSFMVTLRDKVKLATDVWLPATRSGPVPIVLIRTPYGRLKQRNAHLYLVDRGYGLVIQDARGRDDSEGRWSPFINEKDDGEDTLNWLAEQDWCDGNIGMIGASYSGAVQWLAAATGHPNLKALISLVTAGTPFNDIPQRGGAMLSGILAWAFQVSGRQNDYSKTQREDWAELLKIRPIRDIPRKALGHDIPFWLEWMDHSHNDEYWQKADWTKYEEKIKVPALFVSGWYDDDGIGTSQAWELCQKNNPMPTRLILGPWKHVFNTTREIHNIKFGNNAVRYDLETLYVKWFERFLRGQKNGVEEAPRAEFYMVNENKWLQTSGWPPPKVKQKKFYLSSEGNAKTSGGNGRLITQLPGNEPADHFTFDPQNPAPHIIDVSENELNVPENYREMELRDDVLVFTSPPLDRDMILAGYLEAELYASTSAPDTDWVVRLTDVDEKGNSIRLVEGLIRARFRESYENPRALTPGKVYKYNIPMGKIAVRFPRGHRIRVQVTSGAENLVFPNHNTGRDPSDDIEMEKAKQKVYHDAKRPSSISLPILPDFSKNI